MVVMDTIEDTRLLAPSEQQKLGIPNPVSGAYARYYKTFPDRHRTVISGPLENLVPDCSARGAGYLMDAFRDIRGITTRVGTDGDVKGKWKGTFVTLGSSYSNHKTDDIKHLAGNPWLLNDAGQFVFKDGTKTEIESRYDKGVILKLDNPHSPGDTAIICEGLGEWGTSGSVWFLGTHWKSMSRRFGHNPFLVVLAVTVGIFYNGSGKNSISLLFSTEPAASFARHLHR
jgi:hypothetical protein